MLLIWSTKINSLRIQKSKTFHIWVVVAAVLIQHCLCSTPYSRANVSNFIFMLIYAQAENERAAQGPHNGARAMIADGGGGGEGGDGNLLRGGAEGLMNAMRELLHTMTFR